MSYKYRDKPSNNQAGRGVKERAARLVANFFGRSSTPEILHPDSGNPAAALILIDNSGSMGFDSSDPRKSRRALLCDSLNLWVNTKLRSFPFFASGGELAIVSFDSKSMDDLQLQTVDHYIGNPVNQGSHFVECSQIADTVNIVLPVKRGGSPIYGALEFGLNEVAKRNAQIREVHGRLFKPSVLFLITDCEHMYDETVSPSQVSDLRSQMEQNNEIVVFCLGIGAPTRNLDSGRNRELAQLIDEVGRSVSPRGYYPFHDLTFDDVMEFFGESTSLTVSSQVESIYRKVGDRYKSLTGLKGCQVCEVKYGAADFPGGGAVCANCS